MTLPSGNPQVALVETVLADATGDGLPIKGLIRPEGNTWSIEIDRGSGLTVGNRRQVAAIRRLCELDVAIELAVRSGQAVRRVVEEVSKKEDGPHTACAQIRPLLLPTQVHDELYPYQRQGVAWLLRHKRALLGDDMGLGKTAQALAAARRLVRRGTVGWILVVVPRTLIANWLAEAKAWAPELTVSTALPTGSNRDAHWSRLVRRAHVLLTSYEQLRDPPAALLRNPPDLVIADEAHRLRNYGSQSTQGFRKLRTNWFWALTGTPVERDAEDLVVLLSLLDSARFSAADKSLPSSSLRARLRPYMLRRSKNHVLKDLPSVIEEKEILDLTDEQLYAYRNSVVQHVTSARQSSFLPLFNKLRMLCDIEPVTGSSSKLDRVIELLCDIQGMKEKAVVFSYILDPLKWLERRLAELHVQVGYSVITGDMSLEQRELAIIKFKSDAECTALLASTRIASEGLTLTEANHVVFVNQWWNPSSNSQARDRVVRIGQTRIVSIRSFMCRGTVEERLEHLLKEKALTFEELVESLSTPKREVDSLNLIGECAS